MVHSLNIVASDHPIKSVTIIKSGTSDTSKAEVVRIFPIDLKAGQNKIEITGLSSTIDTQSIRISGLGEARLFDVVCGLDDSTLAHYDPNCPAEKVRLLCLKSEALEREKRAAEQQAELLTHYSKTLQGEHTSPPTFLEFVDELTSRNTDNARLISELQEKIVQLHREIIPLRAQHAKKKGEAHGVVTVVIVAQEDTHIDFKLTYLVKNASWEPMYELHATTENGKPSSAVTLHYRARIKQWTGEDWTDAALILSTVSSDMSKDIPRLLPSTIKPRAAPNKAFFQPQSQQGFQQSQSSFQQFQQPQVPTTNIAVVSQSVLPVAPAQSSIFGQPTGAPRPFGGSPSTVTGSLFGSSASHAPAFGSSGFGSAAGTSPSTFGAFGLAPAPADSVQDSTTEDSFEVVPGPVTEPTTVVNETPLAISYSVERASTIPSDGVAHQVSVAILTFEAKVTHVAIPKVEAQVYLQCRVKNTSEYRLLPGQVNVILDDSYVSQTSIHDINKGDTFDCTLGVDSAAPISYTRVARTVKSSAGPFAEAINTTTYTSRITVHNKHQFAISDLIVRDAVPVSGDKRIKVILRKPDGLAAAKQGEVLNLEDGLKIRWSNMADGKGGEKEGKFDWLWSVEAGQKIKLEGQWEVKAPADLYWIDSVSPNN